MGCRGVAGTNVSRDVDWVAVDDTRQYVGLLGLPLDLAKTLPIGSSTVRKYWEGPLNRFVVGKRVVVHGRPLIEALREPQLQERLRHDHLVPIITVADVVDLDKSPPERLTDQVELITPFYENGSVFEALVHKTFNVVECLDVIRAAALGTSELHRDGIVHRDLKSPNVFLTGDAHIARVGDLGEAHPMDASGEAPGLDSPTPWIAPEQVAENVCTAASDLFGLGVMLVEMLRGGLDLSGYNRGAAHRRMVQGLTPLPAAAMTPPPWAPPAVRTMIRQLTDRHSDRRRPISASEVADRLSTVRAIGWVQVDTTRWEGTARRNARQFSLDLRELPRLGLWESRIERRSGASWRSLETSRHPALADGLLQDRFDRALVLAG